MISSRIIRCLSFVVAMVGMVQILSSLNNTLPFIYTPIGVANLFVAYLLLVLSEEIDKHA